MELGSTLESHNGIPFGAITAWMLPTKLCVLPLYQPSISLPFAETFVAEAARVLAAHGVTPLIIPDPAPTPAIAYAVREYKTGGSINFTASHNLPEYNGIK